MHLRLTFLDSFQIKGSQLKDKNHGYKIDADLISKYGFLQFINVIEKRFIIYLESEVNL